METKLAPLTLGSLNLDPAMIIIGVVVLAVCAAFALGAKRETALVAVFAGVVGVILAV